MGTGIVEIIGMETRDGTGIVEIIGMETRDGHRYCGDYWNGDTRWIQVLWRLLEWRHEMGKGHKIT